jgi:hypothetical protein
MKGEASHEYESEFEDMSGLPNYRFFRLKGNSIVALETNSSFAPTWFVKLDSTYLEGNFSYYNSQTDESGETTFFTHAAVIFIRNEILARNGYRFPEPELQERFSYLKTSDQYDSIDEVVARMNDIERHNFNFLERMISRMQGTAL